VIYRKRSFLSTMALGLGAFVVTATLSCTAVILYGMNIADRKSDDLAGLVKQAIRGLPELQKSLPPVLTDLLEDERRPDYLQHISVSAELVPVRGAQNQFQPVVEIQNRGTEVVSLLSLNLVILQNNRPVSDWTLWGATPLAVEDDWRGPLLPGARRRFDAGCRPSLNDATPADLGVEVEITDIRIWKPARERVSLSDRV